MKAMTAPTLGLLALLVGGSAGGAGTTQFDEQMEPLVEQYAKIHRALAGDRTGGVAAAAKKIAALSKKLDARSVTGKHAEHYRSLPAKIGGAAKKLAKAKSIAKARDAFRQLSRSLALWATMSKPAGIKVVFCSMAKGSWLQRTAKIRNPYYGKKMLSCGSIVSGDRSGHGEHSGHAGHHHHK